jgi:hypothetical protein
MRIMDFNLGPHYKTKEPQWRFYEVKDGVTTLFVVDRRSSELQPEDDQTRFIVSEMEKLIFESPDKKFRILPVKCITALPQIRSREEYTENENEQQVSADPTASQPVDAAPKKRRQKARRYVDLPEDGKKAKLPGRPRDRKLGKGGKQKKGKKVA